MYENFVIKCAIYNKMFEETANEINYLVNTGAIVIEKDGEDYYIDQDQDEFFDEIDNENLEDYY